MLNAKKCSNLAEREGFEPSVPVTQYARLAIWCLRPLGHLSASKNLKVRLFNIDRWRASTACEAPAHRR
jgi:hypothetical protein